jgi:3'-phosphoadenosine 5'-phosphosulfate sulfotransferase (PAPS reductase)/FAD synthetase
MNDPFLITGPAVLNLSGGRTSAYQLWRILQAHRGMLPDDVIVCFANTGREMPCTYDFVQACSDRWSVPVIWLEFQHDQKPGAKRRHRFSEVVNHNSASRNGEPFDRLLESKKIVPDRSRPFCSIELKRLTIQRYVVAEKGWKHWTNVIGFRADESVRVTDMRELDAANPARLTTAAFPLADAGVQRLDVLRFWRQQPFDLQLDGDGDGGNCDGCFHFSAERLGRMFRKYPERMDWWPQTEKRLGTKTMRPGQSYEDIRRVAETQGVLAWDDASSCRDAVCGV